MLIIMQYSNPPQEFQIPPKNFKSPQKNYVRGGIPPLYFTAGANPAYVHAGVL